MPNENCTRKPEKAPGRIGSRFRAEWMVHLVVLDMVFIAAVIGVLVVLLQALWECIHHPTAARAGSGTGSRLPSGRGLRR